MTDYTVNKKEIEKTLRIDCKVIESAIRTLATPGQVTEVRAFDAVLKGTSGWERRRPPKITFGYFNDPATLAAEVGKIETAKAIYFTPNPVKPAAVARADNNLKVAGNNDTTSDTDIERRRFLLLDADPKRPSGVSSTDSEHKAAIQRMRDVYAYLRDLDWPDPVVADSGNGAHLLYRVDEPAEDNGLFSKCLQSLHERFSDDVVDIDTTVHNPARIFKLYGTWACKGDSTEDRPHRLSRILNSPDELEIVPHDLLVNLADDVQVGTPLEGGRRDPPRPGGALQPFDLAEFIERHSLDVKGPDEWQGGQRWTFNTSPMCDHNDGAAFLIQHSSGAVVARCHHNSCSWQWADLRRKLEPESVTRQKPHQGKEPGKTFETDLAPIVVPMSEVDPREVQWLWHNRIAAGRLSLIIGAPGAGKSFFSCDLASRISTGTPFPDGSSCARGSVVLITQEDDPHDVIRPRLDAHHADTSRIHLLKGTRYVSEAGKPTERMFTLADIEVLERTIGSIDDCKLVVIDPIGDYLGGRTDAHRDNEVRSVLVPITRIAEKHGVAVLSIVHTRKGIASHADDLALGSRAFTGLARGVWHLRPDAEDEQRRLLVAGKNNLTAAQTGLAFTIQGEGQRGAIVWEDDPVDMTANQLIAQESGKESGTSVVDECVSWLRDKLAHGEMPAGEIKKQAAADGFKDRTFRRAKEKLRVCHSPSGFGGPWVYSLPDVSRTEPTVLAKQSPVSAQLAKENTLANTAKSGGPLANTGELDSRGNV